MASTLAAEPPAQLLDCRLPNYKKSERKPLKSIWWSTFFEGYFVSSEDPLSSFTMSGGWYQPPGIARIITSTTTMMY